MKYFPAALPLVLWSRLALGAPNSGVEEHIRGVESGIAPPVLVQDEAPQLSLLADRMRELHVPGVSIAVMHGGRIEWARGYGVTRAGGTPVTTDTLFQAASISKPVFALAVLHFVEDKELDLDVDVNVYLKQWKLPENDFTRHSKVTLRRLLSHTGGTTVSGFMGYARGAPLPGMLQILDGLPPANSEAIRVDMVPGSQWRYSGGGYVVLQQVLQDLTGKPLPAVMRETVLVPLGMKHSTYEQPLRASRMSAIAWPHHANGNPTEGGPHAYPEMAPAGLWTTASDLARYALGVQSALNGRSSKVIGTATAQEMLTPVIGGQGLGPQLGGATGRKYFTHSGGNEGYRCVMVSYGDGDGAVVMTSADSGDGLASEVIRTIASVYAWPDFKPPVRVLGKVDPELLQRYVGAYELNDGANLLVRKHGNHLVSQVIGDTPLDLDPSSDHEFFTRSADVTLNFTFGADVGTSSVRLSEHGRERTGTRMDSVRERALNEVVDHLARRFREQKPLPGAEAALRALLTGISKSAPDYSRMSSGYADETRKQLPALQKFLGTFGALRKLGFHAVTPEGSDEYYADFESGEMRLEIRMSGDGLIEGVDFLPR